MIYFVQAGEDGPIKIGHSKNPRNRLAYIQTGCPYKIKLLGIIDVSEKGTEKDIHKKFSHIRMRGEWFHPTQELMRFIRDNAECERPNIGKPERRVRSPNSTSNMARILGITPGAISNWKHVPAKHVLTVEKETGISRYTLRPDIYGEAP